MRIAFHLRSRPRACAPTFRSRVLALVVWLGAGGCGHLARAPTQLPNVALLSTGPGAEDRPALFLTAEPGSAQIGFVSSEVALELTGPAVLGRVPVRIEGPLSTQGYVAADQLSLRVQKRGRIRGTPAYVGPDDRVRVLGPDREAGRLRVEVSPRLGERALGRYEGSFPRSGLAVSRAPDAEAAPEPGVRYRVPALTAVPLFELPATGSAPDVAPIAELAPQPEPYEVSVVRVVEGWLAVRAGSGPYLIGWTHAPLLALPEAASPPGRASRSALAAGELPTRLAHEQGELRRVSPQTRVLFGSQLIGVFKTAGWARVQREYPGGFVDVFAAADDDVALRGVVRSVDLGPADVSERSTPAAARSPAP
ncbi:MAG: hypothetical protein JWN04_2364 [Myxococcaceae bacterium]|nr:hypothetical protein [Myxococcaceae bacterium]